MDKRHETSQDLAVACISLFILLLFVLADAALRL
jgi:hypothetical protein